MPVQLDCCAPIATEPDGAPAVTIAMSSMPIMPKTAFLLSLIVLVISLTFLFLVDAYCTVMVKSDRTMSPPQKATSE